MIEQEVWEDEYMSLSSLSNNDRFFKKKTSKEYHNKYIKYGI